MRIGDKHGQISVFLCIIMAALVALAGVLTDASRIAGGEAQVKRAVAGSIKSALAGYNGRLKNEFGIFAFEGGGIELEDTIKSYIERNLSVKNGDSPIGSDYLDLYGFKVEEIKATPLFNLTENEAVKKQVLEYMKYRAPKEVAENIWEMLSTVSQSGSMCEAYKRKTDVEKLLSRIDGCAQELQNNIDGIGKDKEEYYVNGFNKNGSRDMAIRELVGLYNRLESLTDRLEEIEDELESCRGSDDPEDIERAAKLKEDRESVLNRISSAKKRIDDLWDILYREETANFIQPNMQAEKNIIEIMELSKNADKAIESLELYMSGSFDESGGTPGEFKDMVLDDIVKMKELVLESKRAQNMLEDVRKNEKLLKNAAKTVDDIKKMMREKSIKVEELYDKLRQGLEGYSADIRYDYLNPGKSEKVDDPRKGIAEKVREALAKGEDSWKDIEEEGIDMKELPSRKKIASCFIGTGDGSVPDREGSKTDGGALLKYGGNLEEIDKEIDFTSIGEKFTGNALNFISSMGNALAKGMGQLKDDIYINEYIMGTFKNSVDAIEQDGAFLPDMDLRAVEKSKRDTFFQSEVEYILHGNKSEKMNRMLTESQILLIRFAMNTIHVYMDATKKQLATDIAAAVAGWWTGGAGIPIVANLVMCGWAMGEALVDLKDLKEGKKVPFYKSAGDWKLDMGLPSGGKKTDSRLSFSYHDYLRLLLLFVKQDTRISRIEDLVELNMRIASEDFRMGLCNTYIRVEATVSMKYLFVTGAFMPARLKTTDGRHRFKVVLYDGY